MSKCECGRELKTTEKICPSCQSSSSSTVKKASFWSMAVGAVLIVGDQALNEGKATKAIASKFMNDDNKKA